MNALYDKGRESFLKGEISWSAHDIKVVLIDTAQYTPNLSTHQFLSDIPAPARVATSGNLSGKTTDAGIANANDVNFPTLTGATCEALVIFADTGNVGTSRLIAYIDTATGLPVTPNGGAANIVWSDDAPKIFKL
jgi:hypothetical protein